MFTLCNDVPSQQLYKKAWLRISSRKAVVENFIHFEILLHVGAKFEMASIGWQIKSLIWVEYHGYKNCKRF
jgi:hypothetical protein